jgi:hypothetical protein
MTDDAAIADAAADEPATNDAATKDPGARGSGQSTRGRLADHAPLLPEQSRDDTDLGWGERSSSNDDRLLQDRPPHWD